MPAENEVRGGVRKGRSYVGSGVGVNFSGPRTGMNGAEVRLCDSCSATVEGGDWLGDGS